MPASPRRWWWSASSTAEGLDAPRARPRGVHRAGVAVEGGVGRHHHPPAPLARRLPRLEPRALHHGRGPVGRGAQGLRRAPPGRADLPRQAARQLGPQAPYRGLRPRGREPRDQGLAVVFQLSDRGQPPANSSRSRRPGPRPCWAIPASPSIPTTSATASGRRATRSCRWSAAASRSSPTPMPIPQTGSGAVKITPAHDFNDFEVGRRHGLPLVNVFDRDARLNDAVPAALSRPRPLRRAQAHRRRSRGAGPRRQDRGPHADGALWRPLRRRDRAVADRPVVLRRQDAGGAGDRGGRARPHRLRAAAVGEHLLRMDAQHPAVVHLAPDLVGPSDPGLVRARRPRLRRGDRGRGARGAPAALRRATWRSSATPTCSTPGSPRRCGRSRPWAGPRRRRRSRAITRPTCWSPASTSSSSGSRG